MVGLRTCMDGERVVVDRRLEDVQEEAARTREEASQAAKAELGQKWDSGECVTGTGGALRSVLYQSQCYEERTQRNGGRGRGGIQTQKHASLLLFVCLFVFQKKNLTGIV